MPRYRDRTVPSRISSPGPLAESVLDVTFTDGYAPTTNDPDIMSVHQGGTRTSALNEVGYFRATWVTGHNSDALFRAIETAGATGNAYELEDVTRTKRPFGVDAHTGAIKRYDLATQSLIALGPTDARPTDPAAGVTFTAASMFASSAPPQVYGARLITTPPELAVTATSGQPAINTVYACKVYCHNDMTLTTISMYVRTATTGAAAFTGYAVYDDGATMNLLGSTVDDTALFQSTSWRAKNLQTPVALVGGNFYWLAFQTNWTTTQPQLASSQAVTNLGILNSAPGGLTTASLGSQTSFTSTITKASMTGITNKYLMIGY